MDREPQSSSRTRISHSAMANGIEVSRIYIILSSIQILTLNNLSTVTVTKAKHIISINVNGFESEPNIGHPKDHRAVLTTRPLFLGGHPHMERIRGMKGRQNYQGCIRNIKINDEAFIVDPWMTLGNVEVGVCPLS